MILLGLAAGPYDSSACVWRGGTKAASMEGTRKASAEVRFQDLIDQIARWRIVRLGTERPEVRRRVGPMLSFGRTI